MPTRRRASWSTIRRLPSGRWQAFYRVDGQQHNAPQTFPTKAEAGAWLATERADRSRGAWVDPNAGRVTVENYTRAWLAARADLSPRTRDLYTRHLDRWIVRPIQLDGHRRVEIGSTAVRNLTPELVRRWYAAVRAQSEQDVAPISCLHGPQIHGG